ncbi:MAG: hypothetical protein PWP04_1157 [Candidatus Atribacteria bacterium]|nr:hypothetical protein [Candidatus Atribacteria bacterium]
MENKRILCFGDSLTWGYNPRGGERFSWKERWTGVLERELGAGFRIIEEGLNGRTTVWDDPIEGDKSGKKHLTPLLESHRPLDLVVIMLGTNDLKDRFALSPFDIALGAGYLVEMVQKSKAGPGGGEPSVLLIAPPALSKLSAEMTSFQGGVKKSKELGKYYRIVAAMKKCHFLDAGEIVQTSEIDGVHWEEEENLKFARALAQKVREVLSRE